MDFADALKEIKTGKKITREGWNGKGMFVYYVAGSIIEKGNLRNEAAKHIDPTLKEGSSVQINGHLDMKSANGSIIVGWSATQTDMMAEDWCVVH